MAINPVTGGWEPDPPVFDDYGPQLPQPPPFDFSSLDPTEGLGPMNVEPTPNDFWSRVALGGGQFQPPQFNSQTPGGGLLALLALASGFAQGKTNRAARNISEVDERNARARQNASELAKRRWELKKMEAQAARAQANLASNQQFQLALAGQRRTSEPLESVVDPATGKGVLVPRGQAAGRQPYVAPNPSEQRLANSAARQATQADVNSASKLADDWRVDPDVNAYRTAQQNIGTMESAAKLKSGPGDLALLIAYVRATEPGVLSVVRQEELKNVQSAVGELRKHMMIPDQWVSGRRLTEPGRQEMLSAGRAIGASQRAKYEAAKEQIGRRAKAAGIDPTLVIREYGPGVTVVTPNGQSFTFPTQEQANAFKKDAGIK